MITALFKNTRTLKFKSCLRNCVFGCRQHNYDHKQRSYEETHKADQNPPIISVRRRSAKMIDGSEERKRQLAFELQNSRVFEKRSKGEFGKTKGW